MNDEQKSTPPVEGDAGQIPASQTTDSSQDSQQQDTGQTQVEGADTSQPSRTERRRPSDFIKQRQEMKAIRQEMSEIKQLLVAPRSEPAKPADLREEYAYDPYATTQKLMEQTVNQQLQSLEERLATKLDERLSQKEIESGLQEAKELIYSSDTVKRNPTAKEEIADIIEDNGLDMIAQADPVKAARLALKLYETDKGVRTKPMSGAPTKTQMTSTATGHVGSTRKLPTVEDIRALKFQLAERPQLANDPEFAEKLRAARAALVAA